MHLLIFICLLSLLIRILGLILISHWYLPT